jgi:hypothetical protein
MTNEQVASPRVLDALLARSAGIAHVGIVGGGGADKIVTASYRSYVKGTEVMIAAIPLEMAQLDRSISSGANVFDFAIQGHYSADPQLVRRNFEYIFKMGPMRAREYAATLADKSAQAKIVDVVDKWLRAVKDLPKNDLTDTAAEMDTFDSDLENVIRVRLMYQDGTPGSTNIKLTTSAATLWLANYLET